MAALKYASCAALSVSLIVILFCASVVAPTFSVSYYMNEYKKYDLSEKLRVSWPDIEAATKNLQRYMAGFDRELDVEVRVAGVMRPFYNAREIFHMRDVKGLFDAGFTVLWVASGVFVASLAYIVVKKYYRTAAKAVIWGAAVLTGTFGALAAVIALNFDRAFVIFHEIFFDNDMWLLDPDTDFLINLMPDVFFNDITRTIAIYFFTGLAASIAVCVFITVMFKRAPRRNG